MSREYEKEELWELFKIDTFKLKDSYCEQCEDTFHDELICYKNKFLCEECFLYSFSNKYKMTL